MTLNGRVALVTGGSRGIGKAIAVALAEAGANVALSYRSREEEAEEVVRTMQVSGRHAVALQADVGSAASIDALVKTTVDRLGPVDVLVCNAGVGQPARLEELTLALWEETLNVNLRSAFLLTQAVVPTMRARKFGRLIYLSSTAAQVGGIVGPHYAASKAGLLGLMHSYASQLAKEGITANAICPALVATEMLTDNPRAPKPESLPVGRFGRPEEAAEVAVMLAHNAFITGQTLQVNGGVYMT
ncbi:MAG: SDR family NAD(P)-dependent oxidoreductase [Hyalangium sp.]|uniref:SDR family NAD(P)-dependent oxidoreductase n=1 Tax=Hyalangium sp. TaxID=2028555 RepID=UPI00389A35AC